MASSGLNLFLGVFLSIVGAIINGAGYIVQKLAHKKMQLRPKEKQKNYVKDPMWWLGFLVYAIGSLLQAAGLAFAAQSLLTPMASLTLVANALMAPKFLGEKLARKDIWATAVIVAGTVLTVVFGPHDDTEFDISQLWALYIEPAFIVFSAVLGGFSIIDYIFVKWTQRKNRLANRVLSGDLGEPTAKFLAISYVYLAGVFSAYTLVLTKSTAEIVSQSFGGHNQFDNFLSWLLVITFVSFNVFMEYWKQLALSIFDAVFVVPVAQVILVVLSTLAGGVYFKELGSLTVAQALLFSLGVLVICVGIYILAQTEASETWKTILKVKKVLKLMKVVNAFKATRQAALKAKMLQAPKLLKALESGQNEAGVAVNVSDEDALGALRSAEADDTARALQEQQATLQAATQDGALTALPPAADSNLLQLVKALSQSDEAALSQTILPAASLSMNPDAPSEPVRKLSTVVAAVMPEKRVSINDSPALARTPTAAATPTVDRLPSSAPSLDKVASTVLTRNLTLPVPNPPPISRQLSKPITVTEAVQVDETRSRAGFHIPTQAYNSIFGGLWQYVKTRGEGVMQKARLHIRDAPTTPPVTTTTTSSGPIEEDHAGDVKLVLHPKESQEAVTSTTVEEYHISAQEAEQQDKQLPALGETISRTITVTDDKLAQRTVSVLVIHRPSSDLTGSRPNAADSPI